MSYRICQEKLFKLSYFMNIDIEIISNNWIVIFHAIPHRPCHGGQDEYSFPFKSIPNIFLAFTSNLQT